MKQKLMWAVLALIVLSGLVTVIYFGLQPRPLDKIKLSVFESPTVAANSVLLRLRQELINQKIWFLGMDPNQNLQWQILDEVLKVNTDPMLAFPSVLIDSALEGKERFHFNTAISFDFSEDPEKLLKYVTEAHQQGQRLLVILPNIYASQKVQGSLAQTIVQKYETPISSILMVSVPRRREDDKDPSKSSVACQVGSGDINGTGRLGCLVLQKARSLYLKKMDSGKMVGYLDQIGGSEYTFAITIEP